MSEMMVTVLDGEHEYCSLLSDNKLTILRHIISILQCIESKTFDGVKIERRVKE